MTNSKFKNAYKEQSDLSKILSGEKVLFAEDCDSEAEFHDLENLKSIIEEENNK